jgi:hypothetical protein
MNDNRDVLAEEFAEYRHVARVAFRTPPTDGVFAAARRRAVHRRVAATIAVAGAVVLALMGTVVLQPFAASRPAPGDPSPAAPSPTPSSVPSPSPSLGPGPATGHEIGNDVRFLDQETAQTLRSMTITLPPWPDAAAGTCMPGQYTFRDGTASTGEGGDPWQYRVLHKGLRGIFADIHSEPGDEILIPLGCGPAVAGELSFELLAIRVGEGGPRALGYVTGADVPGFDRFFPDGDDLVVEVQDADLVPNVEQRRRYRFDGTRFVQVGGPTSFPARIDEIPADLAWLQVGATGDTSDPHTRCGSGGMLSFVDGRSGVWEYREEPAVIASAEFMLGAISRGALEEPFGAQRAAVLVTLTCRAGERTDQWVHRVGGEPFVAVGVDGVTGIVSHRITNGLAEVTVETATRREVRTYRSNGVSFTRES